MTNMTLKIPFHKPYITEDEINAVADSMRQGWLTMGPKTVEFEKQFARAVGAPHAVAVNSCTAALHLALKCIDLKPGDEVIIPAMTFVATAEVVRYFDAVPVLVDIEGDTHNMDVSTIERKISGRTRAIIPVHFAGQPADMDEIMDLAGKHNLTVIEDAAHSFPALYKDRRVGSIGHITCYSFYATKTITTGEGGMAVTANEEWAERMRVLRLHGISRDAWKRYTDEGTWRYDVIETGYKYNMTDPAAAMGLEQLKKAEMMKEGRSRIAELYTTAFSEKKGLIPYTVKNDRDCAWHLYPLKLDIDVLSISRDRVIEELKERGIGTSMHFIPLPVFSHYGDLGYRIEDFPGSRYVFERTVSLPIYYGMSDDEVGYVIESVLDVVGEYATEGRIER
ncbi:MAG: UDP-4-amino-4,6-dideoxy-N-acetyl-beta-L-altrosamine transaminase [Spirochaetae bacterium HGW-Spirochaetae-1]|nr:MAG: UDP-4-amino-4,6-dideoxy-N-acetyl-beta-L-altrosamine transaminase [Spirochaetae bacterium HGW-Spirochaetae-1]